MPAYRQYDCYKCGNDQCNDELSQFIPSLYESPSGFIECENFRPIGTNKIEPDSVQ